MKIRSWIAFAAAALLITPALAQSIEYDDMYFTSKDRQKLKEKQAAEQAALSSAPATRYNKGAATNEVYADRGESSSYYSPRNQNPEYIARSNSETAADDGEYFTSDYRYANASNLNNFNHRYSNWYNSPWVANNYWGSSIYGWNTPYYGSYYDTWGNPWMNPYYRSGWSSSFSFHYGNSWNYGWGSNYGMGFSYGNPYYWGNPYYNSWAGMGAGWGSSWGWGNGWYRYPSSVVIVNDNYGRNHTYGKRGSQNGMVTRQQSVRNSSLRPSTTPTGTRPSYNSGSSGGRIATGSSVPAPSRGQAQRQDDYYNRNWRSSRQGDAVGGGYSQPSRSSQSSGWNNSSQWNNSNRSSGYDNGRSGSYNSGGATRSSAPASSGSNGRSRGRD